MALKTIADLERRHASATVEKHRFGNTAEILGLTYASQELKRTADAALAAARNILEHTRRVRADTTKTDAARLLAEAQHARSMLRDFDERFLSAVNLAHGRIDELMPVLERAAAPTANAGTATAAAQIRDRLAKMPEGEKMKLLNSDKVVRAAVVEGGTPMLSGVSQATFDRLWKAHVESVAPQEAAQYVDLTAALEAAKLARTALNEEAASLIDFARADLIAKAKVE